MRVLLLMFLLGCTLGAQALDWSFRGPNDEVPHNSEEYVWAEDAIELPEYPDREKMTEIDFDRPAARYRFFIDLNTLRIADNDVVHYVLLLRSRSGSENLMYEGIRCGNSSYKTFAYGTRKGRFQALRKSQWKAISKTANNWFRAELSRRYFCNRNRLEPVSKTGILDRINNPGRFRAD